MLLWLLFILNMIKTKYDRFEMVCHIATTARIIQNEMTTIWKHIHSNDINANSFSHILAISVYYEKHKPKYRAIIIAALHNIASKNRICNRF